MMDWAAVPDFGAARLDPGYALLPRALSGVPVM
jgi:hypothetical protein